LLSTPGVDDLWLGEPSRDAESNARASMRARSLFDIELFELHGFFVPELRRLALGTLISQSAADCGPAIVGGVGANGLRPRFTIPRAAKSLAAIR
jgi:hypothetical protein